MSYFLFLSFTFKIQSTCGLVYSLLLLITLVVELKAKPLSWLVNWGTLSKILPSSWSIRSSIEFSFNRINEKLFSFVVRWKSSCWLKDDEGNKERIKKEGKKLPRRRRRQSYQATKKRPERSKSSFELISHEKDIKKSKQELLGEEGKGWSGVKKWYNRSGTKRGQRGRKGSH